MRLRPFRVAMTATGGFSLVLAFMLWLVVQAITDDAGYDLVAVAALSAWTGTLIVLAVIAFAGAVASAVRPRRDRVGALPGR